jgi:signal transduction histidine kinase/ActR/RegA family two-component response regulator
MPRQRGEVTVQKRAVLVRDAEGRPKSALIVVTDITESKQLEARFLRAQRLESLGSLASGIAHDLNNVLTPILMSAQMLGETLLTEQESQFLRLLTQNARRGADIVQQLLLYGRGGDSRRVPMNVGSVIRDMEQMMRETFPKAIAVCVERPAEPLMMDGDSTQIHQVLLNLCVNARDAMPNGGRLLVRAGQVRIDAAFAARNPEAKPGPYLALEVKDTGVGIASGNLDKIFDPFFTTKPFGHGTGLGLASVLGIVRNHGGFLTVESREGEGSEFVVYLPARVSPAEPEAGNAGKDALRGHGELVLVIDDEGSIRNVLGSSLRHFGYTAVTASDGAEGMAVFAARRGEIRIVLTDLMMPVMDGNQVIREVRALDPVLPVIAMSGAAPQGSSLETTYGPNLRFLPKPFLIPKALALIKELLAAARPPGSP